MLKGGPPLLLPVRSPTRTFTAVLEPAQEGGYVVKCLELPVATQGETRAEAIGNIKEAVEGYLEVRAEILGKQARTKKNRQLVEIAVKQAPGPVLA